MPDYQFPTKLKGANSPPPIGRCIYCDSKREPLTKEHVLPRSLRGNLTLLRASCSDCQNITRDFERTIGRDVFGDARKAHGFRIKEPPLTIPMRASPAPNSPIIDHIPSQDAPLFLSMFVADPPGLFTGRPKDEKFNLRLFLGSFGDAGGRIQRRIDQGLPSSFYRHFNLSIFARFLAKVGLGLTVYTAGLESFDPTAIRRLILGKDNFWAQLVGGTNDDEIVLAPPDRGHRFTLYQRTINSSQYAVAQIQLFAHLGAPIYSVVVGGLNEAGIGKFDPKDYILVG